MAAYKDEQRGTWYVSFQYYDWTGKNCRKVKRGFKTKREATEWERHFRMKEAADLDMTFEEFVQACRFKTHWCIKCIPYDAAVLKPAFITIAVCHTVFSQQHLTQTTAQS